jgi:hypothetical protein
MVFQLHQITNFIGIFLLGELAWFALLHPLVPTNAFSMIHEVGTPNHFVNT